MDEQIPIMQLRSQGGEAGRLENQVYESLLSKIRSGYYLLGHRLPAENELAAEHGVSRPVVRAALARLRDAGLIVSRRGAGSFVAGGGQISGPGFAPLQSIDDIASYILFRKLIEGEAAARAAERASPKDIANLREILRVIEGCIDAGHDTLELDIKFHLQIAKLSDNRFADEAMQMLREHTLVVGTFVRTLGRDGYRRGKLAMGNEHVRIVDAIEAGDQDGARREMMEHIEASERRVFKGA